MIKLVCLTIVVILAGAGIASAIPIHYKFEGEIVQVGFKSTFFEGQEIDEYFSVDFSQVGYYHLEGVKTEKENSSFAKSEGSTFLDYYGYDPKNAFNYAVFPGYNFIHAYLGSVYNGPNQGGQQSVLIISWEMNTPNSSAQCYYYHELGQIVVLGSVSMVGENPVPEPATILLLASGLAGLGFAKRKKSYSLA